MSADFPRFTPVGDHALLVEFAETQDEAAHEAVLALDAALSQAPCPGLREWVPAIVNLLVVFDPRASDHAAIRAHVEGLLGRPRPETAAPRRHEVGVCYDESLAPDLDEVADRAGMSPEAVIAAHLGAEYRVTMYGFAPGYAYLAGIPEALRLDRKTAPVRGVPDGSVIIAGAQCLVTTLTMPTGWWRLGRSPAKILTGDEAAPFLFDVGDRVRFTRLTLDEYHRQTERNDG